jgi:hypothetical protein
MEENPFAATPRQFRLSDVLVACAVYAGVLDSMGRADRSLADGAAQLGRFATKFAQGCPVSRTKWHRLDSSISNESSSQYLSGAEAGDALKVMKR